MVFVWDLTAAQEREMEAFEGVISKLRTGSAESRIYVLLHKTDMLAPTGSPSGSLKQLELEVRKQALPTLTHCFGTSIWDESIYRAWSAIISQCIPYLPSLQAEAGRLLEKSKAEEILILDAKTLLCICHASRRHHPDGHRFGKISNMIRRFRSSTRKFNATPVEMKLCWGEDGTAILLEQLNGDVVLLAVLSQGKGLETVKGDLCSFASVLRAIAETRPEIDPHML